MTHRIDNVTEVRITFSVNNSGSGIEIFNRQARTTVLSFEEIQPVTRETAGAEILGAMVAP